VELSSRSLSREDVAEGLEQAAVLTVRHLSVRAGLGLTTSMALGTLNREGPARVTTLAAVGGIGRALLDDQRRERHERLTEMLAALPAEYEARLTPTMQVALPIIGQLIHSATNPALAQTVTP
jgi:hypothetical protein